MARCRARATYSQNSGLPSLILIRTRLERGHAVVLIIMGLPVCIFAKPPVLGSVKTRLIPMLGTAGAADLASAMLRDVWAAVSSCLGVHPVLATTSPGDMPISLPQSDIWLQGEGDLGQRIARIMARALEDAPAAMAVGADTPGLSSSHIAVAIDALRLHDAVIGPALDGGFYLLALRKFNPEFFTSLPWSTPETCAAMKARLQKHNLSIAEVEVLFDVDTPADLRLLEQHLTAHPLSAPVTRAWWSRRNMILTPA